MQIQFLFVAILFIVLSSCNSIEAKKATDSDMQTAKPQKTENKKGNWQPMPMREIKDDKGVILCIMPMPESWKLNTNGYTIVGANNIRVSSFAPKSFMMNYDQSLQYAYSQTPMRAMPEIGQLIQEDLVPSAAKKGMTYITHYELSEVSKMDKWYSDQLFKALPSKSFVKAYGVDFKDKNGNPAFVIFHVNQSTTQAMETWYYMASLLEADKNIFDLAKKQYIFSLANTRYNLEPIMAYNKAEAQRVGQSWAIFNKKMAANQAAFEASQIAHVNKSNAINDAIMSGYKARDAASDKNQDQFLDYVYERQNVQDGESGKSYKVEYGYNRYWMNSDGEYIGTKQQNYDPNQDENMNDVKWKELNKVK